MYNCTVYCKEIEFKHKNNLMLSEHHKKNLALQKELEEKEDLSIPEIKTLDALQNQINDYIKRYLSRESLSIVK